MVNSRNSRWIGLSQGGGGPAGRKNVLFSPTTASLPAFSSLAPDAVDQEDVTSRPSCTLGPGSAVASNSASSAASSPGELNGTSRMATSQ